MKQLLGLLMVVPVLLASSCSESFDEKDPTEFNAQIADRTDIETAEELIEIYYNYPPEEGTPKLEITERDLGNDRVEVTLIHDNLPDDSQKAVKFVLVVEQKGIQWVVHEIKKNWKCWDGRGHTNWGTEWCN